MDNACEINELQPFEFKAIRMDAEDDGTFPYIKSEIETPLDEPEMYLEESKDHLRTLLEDERKCQLCRQICHHGFIPVKDLESDLTCNLYMPDANLGTFNEAVVCPSCLDSLTTHHSLKNSSNVQDEITITSEEDEDPIFIKMEEVNIKSEIDDSGNNFGYDDEPFEDLTSQNQLVKCKSVRFHHQPTHEDNAGTQHYQCDICTYKTKFEGHFNRHWLLHRNMTDMQVYICNTCSYQTRHRGHFNRHHQKHRGNSEERMYKCDVCSFASKYKIDLDLHKLRHEDTLQMKKYQCDTSRLKIKHKSRSGRGRLKHKDVREVQMYKCDTCGFQTKHKGHFNLHQLRHKDRLQGQTYKCNLCSYTTNHTKFLGRHRRKHKGSSKAQMYECETWNCESKRDNSPESD